jgi:leucyl-tRNA synthetase
MLRSALRSFRLEKEKLLKGKNPPPVSKATIFVAKEYLDWQQTCIKALGTFELDSQNQPVLGKEFMRTFQTMEEVKAIPKENAKMVMPFASYVMNNDVKLRGKEALELTLPFDELSMLSDRKDVIVRQLGVTELRFCLSTAACAEDTKNKRLEAKPGNPCIVFHD